MKQVYKCDYCNVTDDDKGFMSIHEGVCSHNPNNKRCFTCKYYRYVDSGNGHGRYDCTNDEFMDIYDNEGCYKWDKSNG